MYIGTRSMGLFMLDGVSVFGPRAHIDSYIE